MSFWKALSHGIKAIGIAAYSSGDEEDDEKQPSQVREARPRRKKVAAPARGACCLAKREKSVPRYDDEE